MLISVVAVGFVSDPVAATAGHSPSFGESVTDTIADTNVPNTANRTNKSGVYFGIANLTPQARDTTVALDDDTLAFTVTIENTGDAKGVQTVEFRIGDNAVASRKVTLDVNNSTTIEFDGDQRVTL